MLKKLIFCCSILAACMLSAAPKWEDLPQIAPGVKFDPETAPAYPGMKVSIIQRPDQQYLFLHDTAITEHKGILYAAWYNCPAEECKGTSVIRGRKSTDGGKTWSKAWEFGRIGSPPHLLLRKDGSVVVTYGRRRAPFGNRASISYDGCRTFGEEYILSETHCGDLGYPATTELADGSLVTVYYQPYEKDNRTSIFFTKWRP